MHKGTPYSYVKYQWSSPTHRSLVPQKFKYNFIQYDITILNYSSPPRNSNKCPPMRRPRPTSAGAVVPITAAKLFLLSFTTLFSPPASCLKRSQLPSESLRTFFLAVLGPRSAFSRNRAGARVCDLFQSVADYQSVRSHVPFSRAYRLNSRLIASSVPRVGGYMARYAVGIRSYGDELWQ